MYLRGGLIHHTDTGYADYETETQFGGSLTFGSEDDLNCAAGTYTYHQLHSIDPLENPDMFLWAFNVTEVTTSSGVSSGPMNRIAWVDCGYSGEVSKQVFDVFANASGLSWHRNSSGAGGVLEADDCDTVLARAQNVTMFVAEGTNIVLTPQDYLFKRVSDGLCQLNFVPYYNETGDNFYYEYSGSRSPDDTSEYHFDIDFELYPLCLGQAFLNNHCYTLDLGRNMVGIAETRFPDMLYSEEEAG